MNLDTVRSKSVEVSAGKVKNRPSISPKNVTTEEGHLQQDAPGLNIKLEIYKRHETPDFPM